MQQQIQGFIFDISKPIKLITTKNKYWKVTLSGKSLAIQAGKVKADTDQLEKSVSVDHTSVDQAKSSLGEKVKEKLIKGYYSAVPIKQKKAATTTLKRKTRSSTKANLTSGGFLEKGGESTMFEINDSKVRVTRTGTDGKKKVETRDFSNNEQAIQFFESEHEWLSSQGYKDNDAKFVFSFVPEKTEEKPDTAFRPPKAPGKSQTKHSSSIIEMTDDVMSRSSSNNSRNVSLARSNVSAVDDDQDVDSSFKPSDLGPHCSGPIKVLLAETWNDTYDPTGYYMSEKLDGVRCFWTGTRMFSREGNPFFPPKWFVKNWPKSQMDGELFIGRDRFSETLSAIKKKVPIDSEWQKVTYLVFDAPGLKKPFRQRVTIMEKTISNLDNNYIKCHAHRICNGYQDLLKELEAVNKVKGEGLMLRQADSPYQNRRSKNLLKVKTFHDDEATIIGFQAGSGRCTGMVGAFKCKNTHGVEFEIGSGLNDAMRKKPPKIGTVITYKYQEFNKDSGKPRFPIFLRIYQPV